MTQKAAAVDISALTLDFAGLRALDDVSLHVDAGALAAVIGPNGAGKSSLFNCISGIYHPSAGAIRLGDTEIVGLRPDRIAALGLARTFQSLALFGNLTVVDNLLVGAHHRFQSSLLSSMLSLPSAARAEAEHRREADRIVEFLALESYRDLPAQVLPYGVRKRVELGRALCMKPKVLLLDEPVAGLNLDESEQMAGHILDIRDELAITQILIEHDLGFVLDLASQITVLDFGVAIATGRPSEISSNPAVIEAYIG